MASSRSRTPVPMDIDGSSPSTSDGSSVSSEKPYSVGQRIEAKHMAQRFGSFAAKWYSGVVRKVHGDGACDVLYDDGDDEDEVPLKFLRLPKTSKAAAPVKEQQPKAAAPVKEQQSDASDEPDEPISKGRGKRKIVPTTCMVDGFAVKRQNMYDLEDGEGSVWDRELGEKDDAFAGQDRKEWDAPRERKAAKKGPRVASAAETVRRHLAPPCATARGLAAPIAGPSVPGSQCRCDPAQDRLAKNALMKAAREEATARRRAFLEPHRAVLARFGAKLRI